MADESKHIDHLKKELEAKLGWGKVDSWHSSVFDEMSELVFSKCQVMLSATTLKRFWGVVKHDGQPSITTLDVLSQFVDYKNWLDFKASHKSTARPVVNIHIPKSVYLSIGFVTAVVLISLVSTRSTINPVDLETIEFGSRPVASTYPNSVIFDFDLKGIRSDDLVIQQYWDPTKTIEINEEQTQATGIYYFPGYFRAKLLVDEVSVKEHDLFLKSDGWIATIDYQPVPKYLNHQEVFQGNLKLTESAIEEVIANEEPITTTYHFVTDLGSVSGDNFNLEASIKVSNTEKWAVCQAARVIVLASDGAMIIPFSIPGCSSDNNVMLNDVYLSGKENDLTSFGTDLSDFKIVQLENTGKRLTVSIEGQEVFDRSYSETMGRIVGLRFKFLGVGEVKDIRLWNQENRLVQLNIATKSLL